MACTRSTPVSASPGRPGIEAILSDKDAAAPSLAQTQAARLLPDYHDCLAVAARLRIGGGGSSPQSAGEVPAG